MECTEYQVSTFMETAALTPPRPGVSPDLFVCVYRPTRLRSYGFVPCRLVGKCERLGATYCLNVLLLWCRFRRKDYTYLPEYTGHAVAQLVEALRYKSGDRGFDWTFSFTQPLTEMNTTNISWGVRAAGAQDWQPYHLHVPIVLKSGSLNFLEPSRPVMGLLHLTFAFTRVYVCTTRKTTVWICTMWEPDVLHDCSPYRILCRKILGKLKLVVMKGKFTG